MIVWGLLIVGVVLIMAILIVLCRIEQRKWYREREQELKDWDEGDE